MYTHRQHVFLCVCVYKYLENQKSVCVYFYLFSIPSKNIGKTKNPKVKSFLFD